MLPPIEDLVLRSNPKFAALHASLAANILNPSGSTKKDSAQKERDAVAEELNTARIRAAKRHLIRSAISNLDVSCSTASTTKSSSKSHSKPKESTPPPELLELILLLSSHLISAPLPPSSQKILHSTPQWNSLPTHLPQLSILITNHLQTRALAIARIISPTTNASFLHRTIPKLLSNINSLQSAVTTKKISLETRRIGLVSKTSIVLAKYHVAISQIIHILEQTKHGSLSRHLKTKVEYLDLHAQELNLLVKEKKAKGEKIIYTEEVKVALGNYVRELRDGRERLSERKREAERVLWGYGVGRDGEDKGGKERVMREIARVYGELRREVGEVGRDVEKLKGR